MGDTAKVWTVRQLGETVARTDRFAGGGAVAAMSLVGATATAELVFKLSSTRKKISVDDRSRVERAIKLCSELRQRFERAIDEDIAALERLMSAQSAVRNNRKASPDNPDQEIAELQQLAVLAAIETPLAIARDALKLVQAVDELQGLARPFTASDLGAAAATINGAIVALLLMAEVNLGMVDDAESRDSLVSEIESIRNSTGESAINVIEHTRRVIAGND